MCLFPRLILNRKYLPNKKNNGYPPVITDERTKYVPVGCGKCIECRKQKSRNWQVRLHEDIKKHRNGIFVTFTLSNESYKDLYNEIGTGLNAYDTDHEIITLAVRRFLERWRKKYKKSVRHWLVSECGHNGTENIHLHGIIYTDNPEDISKIWQYGYVFTGKYVNERTINYIVKYITKADKQHKGFNPKVLTSSGIGDRYINSIGFKESQYNGEKTKEYYRLNNGKRINLPIYYRNKLYNDHQKEQLWINLLDKNIRYVCGEKIDISEGDDVYYNVLDYHRRRNFLHGYEDDSKDWDKIRYDRQRRNMMIKQRLNSACY